MKARFTSGLFLCNAIRKTKTGGKLFSELFVREGFGSLKTIISSSFARSG